jgi:hypothetical protein
VRKKAIRTLEKASRFILLYMLKAIPDPKKTTTEADIKLQLQEALVSTIVAIDPSLETTEIVDLAAQMDYIASSA